MLLTYFYLISELHNIQQDSRDLASKFYSDNSKIARSVQIKKYLLFLEEFEGLFIPYPCSPDQVDLYISWLAKQMKYSSITNYLSGLNYFLKSNGATPIDYQDFRVRSVLGGAKRTLGMAVHQALPLLPKHLLRIFEQMSSSVGHTAIRAAILTSFRALLRKCQVTASDSTLRRSDFSFYQWGMIIKVRRSKVIQFSERELLIPVARTANLNLCAVSWCERHFLQVSASSDAPAFLVPSPTGYQPLPYKALQASIKFFSAQSGLNPDDFSSHSLRRGGATFLSIQGASIQDIRVRGDWSSDCVYKYIQQPLSQRIISDIRVSVLLSKN